MLKSLTISHFKGFKSKQILEFSVPDVRRNGSGLTLVVGPNNTGKTTVIEALLLNENTQSKRFKVADRHPVGGDPLIEIEDRDGNIRSFTNLRGGSELRINMKNGSNLNFQAELIPSKRHWQHTFSGENDTSNLRVQSAQGSDIRGFNDFSLGPLLNNISKNQKKRQKFNKYLKLFIPHFTDWAVDTDDGGDFIKYKATNFYHRANLLGDGIISLFRLVAHMITDSPDSTLIIDEPELSLHPGAQKRLAQAISILARKKQIVISTHSPYFVNWFDFLNGGSIIRLNKHQGKKCTVHKLTHPSDYSQFISTNIGIYKKPHFLDTVTKEILFSDKVLFTEGLEDVGLIRNWLNKKDKQNSFDIFGYGVEGETNMRLFLKMSKDLGLIKVGALYDNNTQSYTTDKTTYPIYKLKRLPTDDIRDKKDSVGNLTKIGVFTTHGRLKSRYKSQFESIMKDFITFFSN